MEEMFDDEISWQLTPLPTPMDRLDEETPLDAVGLLAMDVVQLEERLQSVEADVVSYRNLAREALDRVAELTRLNRVLQAQVRHLMGVGTVHDRGDECEEGEHA